jgi:hypothetical protein
MNTYARYIDVASRCPSCDYYDAVTSGILWRIRKNYDKPSFQFSVKTIDKYQNEFMFWGVKQSDYGCVENEQALATVCWLGLLYLNYDEPITRFTQILRSKGENILLYPLKEAAEKISYGEAVDFQAIVSPMWADEVLIEPGYIIDDYITVYTFTPLRQHDKIRRKGLNYEVLGVQAFDWKGETAYFKANCRRLIG